MRLKRGAFGGQAERNLKKKSIWSNTVKPLENRQSGRWIKQVPVQDGAGLRNIHQAIADRVDHEFGRLMDAESFHDIGAVNGYGIHAKLQIVGNFLI